MFGVSSDEFLDYALDNRSEWNAKGQEIVTLLVEEAETMYGEHERPEVLVCRDQERRKSDEVGARSSGDECERGSPDGHIDAATKSRGIVKFVSRGIEEDGGPREGQQVEINISDRRVNDLTPAFPPSPPTRPALEDEADGESALMGMAPPPRQKDNNKLGDGARFL